MKNKLLNRVVKISKSKKGSEILQTIIIIAIIGGIAVTVADTFRRQLSSSLVGRVKDAEWQETANDAATNRAKMTVEVKQKENIKLPR